MSEGSLPDAERIQCRAVVRGIVQGVGFRQHCRRFALSHGVVGFVRNDADGSVEAVFEGPRREVEACLRFCHEGPPRAVVTSVVVTNEPCAGAWSFEVR